MLTHTIILKAGRKIVFYGSLFFMLVSLIGFTVSQGISVEFAEDQTRDNYYNITMGGFSIAILLTLTGTIKMKNSLEKNTAIFFITLFSAVISFYAILQSMFSVGFAAWIDTPYVLQNKKNPGIKIKEQVHDWGAFGRGGKRIVKLTPFMWYWNRVTPVDTTTIKKEEWIYINSK